ncbi:hypothetical protein MHU86_13426 [Fragilaria crotonensis]|nr:hypothetical protein MHU86_13426 [Fragilaria crotonensis]
MKRKRRIATREVYKWKARLNIDGSKQEEGVNYWETFSPVASWAAIRMVLITTLIHGWHTKQIDFVLAYTQAEVECELYMAVPKGFEVEGLCPQAEEESLWSEASWQSVEPASGGQAQGGWFHSK